MNIIKILLILALLSTTGLIHSQELQYNNEKQSPLLNATKSLIIPGWGNLKRRNSYFWVEGSCIVAFGIGLATFRNLEDDQESLMLILSSMLVASFNHTIASIDAGVTTVSFNKALEQKYKLSLSPTYNPNNNGIGIGFAVNF